MGKSNNKIFFNTEKNPYTMKPNRFIDETMRKYPLSVAGVYDAICRLTIGWQKLNGRKKPIDKRKNPIDRGEKPN